MKGWHTWGIIHREPIHLWKILQGHAGLESPSRVVFFSLTKMTSTLSAHNFLPITRLVNEDKNHFTLNIILVIIDLLLSLNLYSVRYNHFHSSNCIHSSVNFLVLRSGILGFCFCLVFPVCSLSLCASLTPLFFSPSVCVTGCCCAGEPYFNSLFQNSTCLLHWQQSSLLVRVFIDAGAGDNIIQIDSSCQHRATLWTKRCFSPWW